MNKPISAIAAFFFMAGALLSAFDANVAWFNNIGLMWLALAAIVGND